MKSILNKYTFLVLATSILLAASCSNGNNSNTATNDIEASTINEEMKDKMNIYVDVINSISKDLNSGYTNYLKYVDETTGNHLGSSIYFMPVISNSESKLAGIEKASKSSPKAPIDALAADYIAKAKTAIVLHNELSAYYGTKENLMDNNAKGSEKHTAYVTALKEFKTVSNSLFQAYDKYYKDGNAIYIASLEKKGDHIRVAANKLMNEAEVLQNEFYDAIPNNDSIVMNPALEGVMTKTSEFQTLIDNYQKAVNSISKDALHKQYLGVDGRVVDFGKKAIDMMTAIRTTISKIKNKDTNISYDYKNVSNNYDDMIQNFNFCKF